MRNPLFPAFLALAVSAHASADLRPNIGVETATTSGNSSALRNAARSYQSWYSASTFGTTSDTVLTGIQFKLAMGTIWGSGTNWASSTLNFSNFRIQLSEASTKLLTDGEYLVSNGAFSSYQSTTTLKTVRNGALSIAAGSFLADGGTTGTHSFGPTINFTTPYTLKAGKSLVLQINHTGYGATGTPLQAFFASGVGQAGTTDAILSDLGSSQANANHFTTPLMVNFKTQAVPEPASMAAMGLGLAAMLRRRRARKA